MIGTFTAAGSGSGAPDPVAGLLALAVLFIGAKIGEELARRLGQPGVVGELAGGFVVGPYALGLVTPGEAAIVLAELGVVVLLFKVGLDVRVDQLIAVGGLATSVAVVGVVLPFVAASGVLLALGEAGGTAAFVGLALTATSVGITSRVLRDLRVLDRVFARVILGAAVIDDILALVAIGILSGITAGNLSASTLLVGVAAVGLVGLGLAAARRARGLPRSAFTWPMFADTPLVPAFIVMLVFAIVSAAVGLAAIVGAFVAGLIIAETEAREEIEREMRPLEQIFAPFFFAVAGAAVDLRALFEPTIGALAVALALIGIVTKLASGLVVGRLGRWNALTVGAGMVPRGEVGIIVADLGLAAGLLARDQFSAVVVAVVLTTLLAPLLLQWTIPRAVAEAPP